MVGHGAPQLKTAQVFVLPQVFQEGLVIFFVMKNPLFFGASQHGVIDPESLRFQGPLGIFKRYSFDQIFGLRISAEELYINSETKRYDPFVSCFLILTEVAHFLASLSPLSNMYCISTIAN